MKCRKISQFILLIAGVSMMSYGAVRGEAAVVLGKAIKLCLECVGIGYKNKFNIKKNSQLAWRDTGGRHIAYQYTYS